MRLRLFISFALVVLVSIASVGLVVRINNAREVRTFMFRGGMAGVEQLTANLEIYYLKHGTWLGVNGQLRSLGGIGSGMGGMMNQRLQLADANGVLLVDTASPAVIGRLTQDDLNKAIPLSVNGSVVGYLLPQGGMTFAPGDQLNLVSRLNRAALPAIVLGGILSLVLASLLTYGLSRPIQDLTQASKKLANGDLSQRVPVSKAGELAELGKAFNQMAESLQQIEESRRALTADVAHELRTPLAVQRAHLEALQDGVYPLTPENLEPILAQNHLLTRLVEDLRILALADSGQLTLERIPTDFPALVQGVLKRFTPQASAKQIHLNLENTAIPHPDGSEASTSSISLDPMRIEQILTNLIDNALRYTPEGGKITLRLTGSEGKIQLAVHDSGPGIPTEDLPHIFERFYRADHSRSRVEGGTGLGLAIARQLAQAHGGSLTVANHPKGGAVFILELPSHEIHEYHPPARLP